MLPLPASEGVNVTLCTANRTGRLHDWLRPQCMSGGCADCMCYNISRDSQPPTVGPVTHVDHLHCLKDGELISYRFHCHCWSQCCRYLQQQQGSAPQTCIGCKNECLGNCALAELHVTGMCTVQGPSSLMSDTRRAYDTICKPSHINTKQRKDILPFPFPLLLPWLPFPLPKPAAAGSQMSIRAKLPCHLLGLTTLQATVGVPCTVSTA